MPVPAPASVKSVRPPRPPHGGPGFPARAATRLPAASGSISPTVIFRRFRSLPCGRESARGKGSVAQLAHELDPHQADLFLGEVAAQLLDRLVERIGLGILLEIEIYLLGLVLVDRLIDIVADIEPRPRVPNVAEGYRFMFTPRWEALKDPMIWIWAMGQAFFSLSVTGSGMIVYGAYLSKDEDVVGVAQHTALFDTIAAVVAALVIIPACFSYGLDVGAGPSLLFVTLPTILQDIPMGRLFAIILYLAMIFAGVSSLQNMFEAVAESLLHKFPKLSRTAVLAILCVLCLGIGIFMEPISKWGPWMDLVSIYIIPIGATLGAISWFYVMKKDELLAAVNTGSKKERGALWYNVGRFVYVPLAVILCCVALFMHVAF